MASFRRGRQFVGAQLALLEAELLGFPTDFISSWPPLDDYDADNVRPEGSSWDIGAQESD